MERTRLAGFGLVLGLTALAGCAEPAPGVVAMAPVAPPSIATIVAVEPPPAEAVWVPPPKHHAVVHHVATARHAVTTRHWVRRHHFARLYYPLPTPHCGSDAHPCNREHVEAPVQ